MAGYSVVPVNNPTLNQNFSVAPVHYSVAAPVAQPQLSVVAGGDAGQFSTLSPQVAGQAIQPTIVPGAAGGGGGGGGGGTPAPDPFAQWGGQANYNRLRGDYDSERNATYGSITDRIGNEATKFGSGIQDFVENLGAGQGKIDAKAVQNELSRRQGTAGVLDMVGHGIRSGGVVLANKNASNSSGGEALARAYSDIGRREQTKVGNQFEQGNNSIAQDQSALELVRSQGVRHINEDKTTTINSIVSDAQNALSQLNSAAATASLPDRIDIEAEKNRIRNDALTRLQQFDATLTNGVAGVHPADKGTNMAKAAQLDTAGTAADTAFHYDSAIPTQFQNTGPFASDLPIFTFPSSTRKTQTAGV